MSTEYLYNLPAFAEGESAARGVIWWNTSGQQVQNPYPDDTPEFRAWNLGWNTTLMSEQP